MTQQHTPLPWRFATKEEQMGYIGCHIMGANGRPVASTVDPLSLPGDLLEDKANALLILQAVNTHEELLAACKLALRFSMGDHLSQQEVATYTDQLAEAIAKARGT